MPLTADERREAEQLQKDEQLRRCDPVAYAIMINKRRDDQVKSINAAISSGQGFPPIDPNELNQGALLSTLGASTTTLSVASFSTVPNEPNQADLQPILGASTTVLSRDSASPERQDDPRSLRFERERATRNTADSLATSALQQALLSPDGPNAANQSPKIQDDLGTSKLPRSQAGAKSPNSVSESTPNLKAFPQLQNILDREAVRMSKERRNLVE